MQACHRLKFAEYLDNWLKLPISMSFTFRYRTFLLNSFDDIIIVTTANLTVSLTSVSIHNIFSKSIQQAPLLSPFDPCSISLASAGLLKTRRVSEFHRV